MTQTSTHAQDIASDLLKINCIEFNVDNPFTWVSGIKSPVYCDNRKITSNIKVRNNVALAFADTIKNRYANAELVAGVATGGIPIGMLVADRLELPFVYVRQAPKKHGKMQQVEGQFSAGQKVVVIEDHISTGGSSMKAIDGLINAELEILGLISIMTYGFAKSFKLFAEKNIDYISICDLETALEVAASQKLISADNLKSILKFRKAPAGWYQGTT